MRTFLRPGTLPIGRFNRVSTGKSGKVSIDDAPDEVGAIERAVAEAGGRNAYPRLLLSWLTAGQLSLAGLRLVLVEAWTIPEWPASHLTARVWVSIFREAGFVSDPPDLRPPSEPLTVYRGATFGRRRGMSWTLDLDRARWFASRSSLLTGRPVGMVFRSSIPPESVLAIMTGGRREAEVVVDPVGLPPIRRSDAT